MSDDIDRAQEINELFQADILDEHRRRMQEARPTLTHCEDCEEEIPEARRRAAPGCRRCIDCQTLHENWRPA